MPKISALEDIPDLRWHFIGRLQANKVRSVVRSFEFIHSVDSVVLAERISRISGEEERFPGRCDCISFFGNGHSLECVKNGKYHLETIEDVLKRNKDEKHLNQEFNLDDNSLLIMSGASQRYFCHSIVKELDKTNPRYSLTFRQYLN